MSSGSEKSFAQLLEAARNGSEEAVGELLDRYRGYLWTIATEEISPSLSAKVAPSDVVQDAFLDTYRDFTGFRGSSEVELKVWLRRILISRIADSVRKYIGSQKRNLSRELQTDLLSSGNGRSLLAEIHGTDSTASTKAIRNEQIAAVQKALSDLPPEQCEIMVRRSIQQESFQTIGASMGRSPDAIRMLWKRTLIKLIDQVNRDHV